MSLRTLPPLGSSLSGDSDFLPVAKIARREGIHFLLDALEAPVEDDFIEHIDGLFGLIGIKSCF